MKLMTCLTLITVSTLTFASPSWAGPFGEAFGAVGDAVGYVGETVGDTASAVGQNVKNTAQEITGKDDPVAPRDRMDQNASPSLTTLIRLKFGTDTIKPKAPRVVPHVSSHFASAQDLRCHNT